jgi:hypothetical protein
MPAFVNSASYLRVAAIAEALWFATHGFRLAALRAALQAWFPHSPKHGPMLDERIVSGGARCDRHRLQQDARALEPDI